MKYFVILSEQRAGSHLLINLLNSHPLIQCNGDLMTADVEKYGANWAFENGFKQHSKFQDEVQSSIQKKPEALGFPIKTKQNLHQYLCKHRELKILFLQRKNLLAMLLSRELGNILRLYPDNGEKMEDFSKRHSTHSPIHIDPNQALSFFQGCASKTEEVLKCLAGTEWLELFYEDLCSQREATMKKVFMHLGVPFHEPRLGDGWGSTKLNKRPLSESIANYAELKRRFQNTAWATYFS